MSSQNQEIQHLADAMFDGLLDSAGVQRLEQLLAGDPSCLQAYLEVVNLHGELLHQADSQTDEQAAVGVLRRFSEHCEQRQAALGRWSWGISITAAVILCGSLGWLASSNLFRPVPLGTVAHLTNDASLRRGSFSLGQTIRKGNLIEVKSGVVSIELPHTMLDLSGPATIKVVDENQIDLISGTVTATVRHGGEGFVIRTTDSEIVDLGTEFLVTYDAEKGTDVSVRRGRARASLLDQQGIPAKVLELTTSRAAKFSRARGELSESPFQPEHYERLDRVRGGIRSISGQLRTPSRVPPSLIAGDEVTLNHMLVLPERQNVILEKPLTVGSLSGDVILPAGSVVSSYLVHYDPQNIAKYAPRGSLTFYDPVVATITNATDLVATDQIFGLPDLRYESRSFRGLEPDADEVRISDDRRTVSVFFKMSPPEYLDQLRLLVISQQGLTSP